MCKYIYKPIHVWKKISDCLIYCILSNGKVIKYHKFISVVVIELSVGCLNTGPEDRLPKYVCERGTLAQWQSVRLGSKGR